MSIFRHSLAPGPDYEDIVDFVQTVRQCLEEVLSRLSREFHPPPPGDEVFRSSDDPRPHPAEWRTLWKATHDGINLFLREHHYHCPTQSKSINQTDFDVARHPLRARANHVLNSKWERRAARTRVDNDDIAEELWFLCYELLEPENERGLLEEFVPWEHCNGVCRQDRDLPELES